jgi:hypothetical protein
MKRLSLITSLASLLLITPALLAQQPLIALNGTGSSSGIDFNGNGLFDFLAVSIGLDVAVSSYYSFSVCLTDRNGKMLSCQSSYQFITSPSGFLHLFFDGTVIGQNGVDGPYYLANLTMQNLFGAGTLFAPNAFATQPFLARQFEGFVARDDTPPIVAVTASPGVLWPANHKMVKIIVNVIATDDHDPNPSVSFDKITSNQGENLTGAGNTSPDILVQDGEIFLRAERSGTEKSDRIYTITFSARDASGNVGTGSAKVTVPHDLRDPK